MWDSVPQFYSTISKFAQFVVHIGEEHASGGVVSQPRQFLHSRHVWLVLGLYAGSNFGQSKML